MGLLWHRLGTPSTGSSQASREDTVGGAVACVVGNRVYLVGGSGTTTNDPDIALGCFSWSLSSRYSIGERQQQPCNSACISSDAAAADNTEAAAPSATISPSSSASAIPAPALVRIPASQEGDVPPARIGHTAVTLANSSLGSPPSSTSTSIFVFGGEASNPCFADENGSGPPLFQKFSDVYKATPKAPSGTLVWRALTPPRLPTPRDPTVVDTEPCVAPDLPAPRAFHAACMVSVCGTGGDYSVGTERALLVHGGVSQSSELLADLWAFFPVRLSNAASNGGGAAGEGGDGGSVHSSNGEIITGWDRLQPQGEGPPPAAYHTATPVCDGDTVVFVGGGKNWGPSLVFLLDTVSWNWSSFETIGDVGLSGQRCLHTAISMTCEDMDCGDGTQSHRGDPPTSPSSPAAAAPGDASSTPTQNETVDAAAATAVASEEMPGVTLWNPVGPDGKRAVPVSARSAGSEKGAGTGAAAAKKKVGGKDGGTAAKKAGTKETAKKSGSSGSDHPGDDTIDVGVPSIDGGAPPVFERVLIFGGIVNEAAVSGDAVVLRHDGTVAPLQLARKSAPPPGPRYSHAMVSLPAGGCKGTGNTCPQLAFLFGGCRGDGTRAAEEEVFVLDLTSGGAAAGGRDDEDEKTDGEGVDGDDAQIEPLVFGNGDLYTGETGLDGRRQGKGRCDYGAAAETAEGAPAVAGGGGSGNGGYYSGDWDTDEPHGRGERVYAAPGAARRGAGGGGGDMAIVVAAFGPGCPPIASYRGGFNRGVREGKGICSLSPAGVAAASGDATGSAVDSGSRAVTYSPSASASSAGTAPLVPESYDGEWVGGRPLGRGILSLRAAPAAATGGAYPSSVKRSGSTMMRGGGTVQNGDGGNGGGGGFSVIEGVWTKEGLVHGREKLPGKGGVYEGQYRLGKREGQGRLDLPDGSEYEGAWKSGRQNGIGTFRCGVTRHVYTGKWVGGVRCGKGVCEYASGSRYEGLWLDGLRHGEGVLSYPSGAGAPLAGLWHCDEFNLVSAAEACRRSTGSSSSLRNVLI